jgi:hypothetical protein
MEKLMLREFKPQRFDFFVPNGTQRHKGTYDHGDQPP